MRKGFILLSDGNIIKPYTRTVFCDLAWYKKALYRVYNVFARYKIVWPKLRLPFDKKAARNNTIVYNGYKLAKVRRNAIPIT